VSTVGPQGHVRRFDRLPSTDQRNRLFPIRALLPDKPPRSYSWSVGVHLDQGQEGACVGFAWGHELAAKPVPVPTSNLDALVIYKRARQLDEWEGEDYDGTSVLGGAKAVMDTGLLLEYRWADTVEDMAVAVSRHGPGVLGTNWYRGMFQPDPDGYLRPTGPVVGGHAICVYGFSTKLNAFRLWNSWGPDWGKDGTALVAYDDMRTLFENQGELCVPVHRGHPA
jgi:hypothetical protein